MPALIPLDPTERLSADDQATLREAEFLAAAVRLQRLRAQRIHTAVPGRCSNCGTLCLPCAVYCYADCRADHEARLTRLERQAARTQGGPSG